MNKTMVATAVAAVLALSACTDNKAPAQNESVKAAAPAAEVTAEQTPVATTNPLLVASTLQYGAPEFDKIKVEHYQPAMEQGIVEHAAEIEKIANNPDAATFENTIVAMEQSGDLLERASSVFYNMTGTISNDEILKIQIGIP